MIKFSEANAKIEALSNVQELSENYLDAGRKVYSFDLLSGFSCPFANECLSRAIVIDGKRKIKDGPNTQFRCFSASQEVQYTNVYNLRKNNFDTLRSMKRDDMVSAIESALPDDAGIVRIHVAGDFFNQDYFDAWIQTANDNPSVLFYAYTKSLQYWVNRLGVLPYNFVLTASRGGRLDHLIDSHNLRTATVVFSESEAYNLGLDIDHDDSHAARPSMRNQAFALLIHGTQPKDSDAAKALQVLKKNNVKHSYSRKVVTV